MRIVVIALSCTVGAFVVGGFVEAWSLRVLQPSPGALQWISDLILASGFGIVLYLWLHLRVARAAVLDAERRQIIIKTELALAAKIQHALLTSVPAPRHSISWAVQLIPAGSIGGDYYDFVDVSGGVRICLVADISGKGIPAAMMLAYARAVFRQAASETTEPREIVSRLASAVYADTAGSPYATCIVLRLDERSRRLTSTNAGHPCGILLGPRGIRRVTVGGPPAGLLPTFQYDQEELELEPGVRGIFVTDGISERVPDFERALISLRPSGSASEVCAAVLGLADDRVAVKPVEHWDDDRTVVVLAIE